MGVTTRSRPDVHTAAELIDESLDAGHVCSIVGRCTVAYDGRTQSTLPAGERLVVCKPDGTLLVHHAAGHKPVNWQPPGGTHDITLIDGELHLQSRRDAPDERVEIRFTDLRQVSAYALEEDHDRDVTGSEDDLRQRILEQPTLVEEGFQPRMTERETSAGPVDIYGVDANGTPVIVECKRRRVGPDAVGQLARYVAAAEREYTTKTVRGILIAPSITDRAERELTQHELKWVALDPIHSV
ncbi:endonuclease NucS [Halocatena pleomorpha]|uniref:Endonuclease NucS n=1 Tax=Halocatena pleomorpha TaxID=1785090 RepID=A0A3P3R6R9_9EURY|nr:endonuclease NucS [Halocatena pleomorpha]RRJ28698.1 DUF91 domain-containing protein [Halocatena pleomorpha]